MSIDQGRPPRHALGIDFGTSNTVAVAQWPDGRARPLLVDGSPLLPSAVYAEPDGQLIVGRDAVHSARLDPARFEPNPKRRIDDGEVLLGDKDLPVVDLIAAVLVRVAEEWHRAVGPVRPDVTLTCPATWGSTRRGLLAEAAARAGFEGVRLVAEPVAAATYFAEVLGRDVPIGSVVVVHDFGAGTFDASVVARTAEGFEVLAVDGRDDIGGLDVDAALVDHLVSAGDGWERLMEPTTLEERRAQRQLWDEVRIAKERLSRHQSADFVVPLLNREVHLTRDELETVARPILEQTVQITRSILRWAELPEGRLAGVFLVGGASRIPLVATLLHRALAEAPVVIEQPELVVAEGSILADAAMLASGPAAPGPTSEWRLVAAKRQEQETVRVSAADLLPEADSRPPTSPTPTPSTVAVPPPLPAASASIDDQATVRTGSDAILSPAVDPWPHAVAEPWLPDPDATVAGEPSWEPSRDHWTPTPQPTSPAAPERPSGTASPAAPAASGWATRSPERPASSAWPSSVSPPASQHFSAGRSASTRPVKPASPAAPRSAPRPPAPAARPPVRRRRGGFLRFLQITLSVLVLIAAPVAAMVLAYASRVGESPQAAVTQLLNDFADLFSSLR
jgi:actin-like ATPase involved in cell morphogenesis